jgi:hypothetical protein
MCDAPKDEERSDETGMRSQPPVSRKTGNIYGFMYSSGV